MPKTEAILPDTTIGGRIQKMRHKEHLSRSDLYDCVYPYGEAGSDANKETTVRNWETGKYELDYQNLAAVCRALNCSSDYLLGLDECTNKTTQFIHEQTGLSESSIDRLIAASDGSKKSFDILFSLEDERNNSPLFTSDLLPLLGIHYYMCYNYASLIYGDNDPPDEEAKSKIHELFEQNQVCQYRISKKFGQIVDEIRDTAFKDYDQTVGDNFCPYLIP